MSVRNTTELTRQFCDISCQRRLKCRILTADNNDVSICKNLKLL